MKTTLKTPIRKSKRHSITGLTLKELEIVVMHMSPSLGSGCRPAYLKCYMALRRAKKK